MIVCPSACNVTILHLQVIRRLPSSKVIVLRYDDESGDSGLHVGRLVPGPQSARVEVQIIMPAIFSVGSRLMQ